MADTMRSPTLDPTAAARIVVCEDEVNVSFVITTALRLAGFDVYQTSLGLEAIEMVDITVADLLVLDVTLDDIGGFEVCQRLRAAGSDIPILFLTDRHAAPAQVRQHRAQGSSIGNDYLPKPFSMEEIVARARVTLQRAGKATTSQIYRCGRVALDDDAHSVTADGRPVDLSPTEYKLLRFLLRNTGRVLTRRQIFDHVWDYDFAGDLTLIETYVSTLRKKLDVGRPHLIHTVRGVGYRLAEV